MTPEEFVATHHVVSVQHVSGRRTVSAISLGADLGKIQAVLFKTPIDTLLIMTQDGVAIVCPWEAIESVGIVPCLADGTTLGSLMLEASQP